MERPDPALRRVCPASQSAGARGVSLPRFSALAIQSFLVDFPGHSHFWLPRHLFLPCVCVCVCVF